MLFWLLHHCLIDVIFLKIGKANSLHHSTRSCCIILYNPRAIYQLRSLLLLYLIFPSRAKGRRPLHNPELTLQLHGAVIHICERTCVVFIAIIGIDSRVHAAFVKSCLISFFHFFLDWDFLGGVLVLGKVYVEVCMVGDLHVVLILAEIACVWMVDSGLRFIELFFFLILCFLFCVGFCLDFWSHCEIWFFV